MTKGDETIPLRDAMAKLLRSLEGGRRESASVAAVGGVFGRWAEIVGDAMSRHVQPVRLDGSRLVVEVTEPAWATQVRLLGDQIRGRVLEVVGVRVETLDVRVAAPPRRRR